MFKTRIVALASALLALSAPLAEAKTFYWISHGSPADPVWTYFLAGAQQWSQDTGHEVNTSFHNGDVASHQEAVRAAIATGADGIVTSSPDPGSLVQVANEANEAYIPIINMNTPDPTASFDAYVGGDLVAVGRQWAQYLVDKGLVESGDFVWMPVEVPGATYGVQEEQGVASVFEPLGITWEVTDATLDQAEVIARMVDYMTANGDNIDAIIGLGDLVTGSIKRVFDQAGFAPGDIPVVGWGNSLDTTREVLSGYVNAAMWQDPLAISYMALSLAAMASSGIPPGFDVITGALYEGRQGPAIRRHPVGQIDERGRTAHPVEARIWPVRPAGRDGFRLLADQSGVYIAAQHRQHAGLHGRAGADRAGHDPADDGRRIRPFGRLPVRVLPGAHVDPVQHRGHVH